MFELGCHLIDMVHLLLGAPSHVTSILRHDAERDDDLIDNALAILEYDQGMAVIETAAMEVDAFPGRRFKVCGPDGKIVLEPLEPPQARLYLRRSANGFKPGKHEIELEDVPRHVRDFADLARCMRGEARFAYSKEHDLGVQKTVLEASTPEA
jgi:predicted dehydrogenase